MRVREKEKVMRGGRRGCKSEGGGWGEGEGEGKVSRREEGERCGTWMGK